MASWPSQLDNRDMVFLILCVIICCCVFVTAVDQSFERMGFGMPHDNSGYTYMPQQMSAQPGIDVNQYSTAGPTATYPPGMPSHHHQVALQVVRSHDLSPVEADRMF